MNDDNRILILEDNPADAELMVYTLRGSDIRFISKRVETEEEFRNSLIEFSPDLILSDYHLPIFTGIEALKITKKIRPAVPFILVTGALGEERAIEIMTGGATDYVMKNRLSRLVPAVERALKETEEHKKRQAAELERDLLLKRLEARVQERTAELQEEINERKRTEEALRESEERFRTMADKLSTMIWVTDHQNGIKFVNSAYCDFFGITLDQVDESNWELLMHPDDKDSYSREFLSCTRERRPFRAQARILRSDGEWRWMESYGNPYFSPSGEFQGFVGGSPDITERKNMEKVLLESEARQAFLLLLSDELRPLTDPSEIQEKACQLLVAHLGADRACCGIYQNEGIAFIRPNYFREDLTSISKRNLIADFVDTPAALINDKPFFIPDVENSPLLSKHSRSSYLALDIHAFASKPLVKDGKIVWSLNVISNTVRDWTDNEKALIQEVGERTWEAIQRARAERALQKAKDELEYRVRERTSQLAEVNKSLVTEIEGRKRTETKLRSAQKNLRAMASEIVLAEERSRQHFSTDLHDTVVQTLGAAKLRSELLREYVSKKGDKQFAELQSLLSQSIKEARQIMAELSPPVLNQFGFIPALEWLTEQVGSQNGLDLKFRGSDDAATLSHEVQVLLFQATRELLMNIIKHSRAQKAMVSVMHKKENIRITVKDDGIGFHGKISFREDYGGFGLFSIRERLRHLGGQLMIQSKPGQGTCVTLVSPKSIEQH